MTRPASPTRKPWQPAQLIRDRLLAYHSRQQNDLPDFSQTVTELLKRFDATQRKLRKSRDSGFEYASRRLASQLERIANDLSYELPTLRQNLVRRGRGSVPSLRDLVAELKQLDEEIGEWDHKRRQQVIAVRTEPITLEDTYLGPFAIELNIADLEHLNSRPPYSVVALDPHPAAGNSTVPHPHVSDDRLCPGDASNAIHQALASGRLCDFFVMVRSILSNYNPESPYVSLDCWEGAPCNDCGYRMSDEDRFYCEGCQNDYCNECISSCGCCDETLCAHCLKQCATCDCSSCKECLQACRNCGQTCCGRCLEDDLCPDCLESMETQDDDANHPRERSLSAANP